MATISLNIDDADLPFVVEALCDYGGWTVDDGGQNAFSKKVLINWVKGVTKAYWFTKARKEAVEAVVEPDDATIT